MKSVVVAAVLACALAVAGCGRRPHPAAPVSATPSVILVTIDTLRADHVSADGYRLPTTPEIDRFAAGGVRFTHAFSASSCTAPSHASILTGLYPSFHSVGVQNGTWVLLPREATLAEILAQRGYRTDAVVSNPVLRREVGLDQGFDSYDDDFEKHERNRSNRERRPKVAVDLALEKLDELSSGEAPFFVWLHLEDPHGPYEPKAGVEPFRDADYADRDARLPLGADNSGHHAIPAYQVFGGETRVFDYVRRYDTEVRGTDHELGRLLARAETMSNLVVIVTADHGEAMGEDGYWFGHGHSVGLDQVRVPLVMAGAGLPEGKVVETSVSNVSIFETVLALVGAPSRRTSQAPSLLPLLRAEPPPAEPILVENLNQIGIVWDGSFFRRDRHAASDPSFWIRPNPTTGGFWKPLAPELRSPFDPASALSLHDRAELERHLDALAERADAAEKVLRKLRQRRRISPEDEEKLKSLGYLGG